MIRVINEYYNIRDFEDKLIGKFWTRYNELIQTLKDYNCDILENDYEFIEFEHGGIIYRANLIKANNTVAIKSIDELDDISDYENDYESKIISVNESKLRDFTDSDYDIYHGAVEFEDGPAKVANFLDGNITVIVASAGERFYGEPEQNYIEITFDHNKTGYIDDCLIYSLGNFKNRDQVVKFADKIVSELSKWDWDSMNEDSIKKFASKYNLKHQEI